MRPSGSKMEIDDNPLTDDPLPGQEPVLHGRGVCKLFLGPELLGRFHQTPPFFARFYAFLNKKFNRIHFGYIENREAHMMEV